MKTLARVFNGRLAFTVLAVMFFLNQPLSSVWRVSAGIVGQPPVPANWPAMAAAAVFALLANAWRPWPPPRRGYKIRSRGSWGDMGGADPERENYGHSRRGKNPYRREPYE